MIQDDGGPATDREGAAEPARSEPGRKRKAIADTSDPQGEGSLPANKAAIDLDSVHDRAS